MAYSPLQQSAPEHAWKSGAFEVDVDCDWTVMIVTVSGELDLATGPLLCTATAPHQGHVGQAIFDLTKLGFIDVAGLRSLLAAAGDEAIPVMIHEPPTQCRKLLQLVEMDHLISSPLNAARSRIQV